jgi:hypothetical protein
MADRTRPRIAPWLLVASPKNLLNTDGCIAAFAKPVDAYYSLCLVEYKYEKKHLF